MVGRPKKAQEKNMEKILNQEQYQKLVKYEKENGAVVSHYFFPPNGGAKVTYKATNDDLLKSIIA